MGDDPMKSPSFKWEWNPNTLLQLFSIVSIIGGGGYALANLHSTQIQHTQKIIEISDKLKYVDELTRKTDLLEFRLNTAEKTASETALNIKSVENTLNNLGSDIRVVREIVQRIDPSSGSLRN